MKVKLRSKEIVLDDIEIGDAILLDTGEIRIIVRLPKGFGGYSPDKSIVYNSESLSIKDLISRYEETYKIVRVIKKNRLELTEV